MSQEIQTGQIVKSANFPNLLRCNKASARILCQALAIIIPGIQGSTGEYQGRKKSVRLLQSVIAKQSVWISLGVKKTNSEENNDKTLVVYAAEQITEERYYVQITYFAIESLKRG